MKTVFLSPNPTQPLQNLPAIVSAFVDRGFRVLMEPGQPVLAGVEYMDQQEAAQLCDLIVTVGGDGTLLRSSKLAAHAGKPMLGINQGTLGYLTELDPNELTLLDRLMTDDYTLDRRMCIDISVVNGDGEVTFTAFGLNDAVVQRVDLSKTVPIAVSCDGAHVLEFRGDGVMVSTPTGSTAYSLSAGGPILEPSCQCLAVTPICPHSLGIKSFVVSADRCIEFMPLRWKVPLNLSVDGYQNHSLAEGERIQIRRSELTVPLVRLCGLGFYERIAKKLS